MRKDTTLHVKRILCDQLCMHVRLVQHRSVDIVMTHALLYMHCWDAAGSCAMRACAQFDKILMTARWIATCVLAASHQTLSCIT